VQYSHARAMSILRKAGNLELDSDNLEISDPEAWQTLRLLAAFPETVKKDVSEYEPSVVAKYAIQLAKAFNKYYAHSRILNDDAEKNARLALVQSVATTLKESLRLLGVKAPNEM